MLFAGYVFGAQKKEGFPENIDGFAERYFLSVGFVFFCAASCGFLQ
jgi:hypothetical protein